MKKRSISGLLALLCAFAVMLSACHGQIAGRETTAAPTETAAASTEGQTQDPSASPDETQPAETEAPGLGIEALNEDLIKEKLHSDFPEAWAPTEAWDKEWANDRRWS